MFAIVIVGSGPFGRSAAARAAEPEYTNAAGH